MSSYANLTLKKFDQQEKKIRKPDNTNTQSSLCRDTIKQRNTVPKYKSVFMKTIVYGLACIEGGSQRPGITSKGRRRGGEGEKLQSRRSGLIKESGKRNVGQCYFSH